MSRSGVAYYDGRDKFVAKKAPSQPVPRDKRNMIHALGRSDNPCLNFYDPKKKATIVQHTKALKSGPARFGVPVSEQSNKSRL